MFRSAGDGQDRLERPVSSVGCALSRAGIEEIISMRALILSATVLSTFLAPGIALAQSTGSSPKRAETISEIALSGFSLSWLPGVVRGPDWLMTTRETIASASVGDSPNGTGAPCILRNNGTGSATSLECGTGLTVSTATNAAAIGASSSATANEATSPGGSTQATGVR